MTDEVEQSGMLPGQGECESVFVVDEATSPLRHRVKDALPHPPPTLCRWAHGFCPTVCPKEIQ